MPARIRHVRATRQHCNRDAATVQTAPMSHRVDAERETADHRHARCPQAATQAVRNLDAVGGRVAGAHDRHRRLDRELCQTPLCAANEQHGGRIVQVAKNRWINGRVTADSYDLRPFEALAFAFRRQRCEVIVRRIGIGATSHSHELSVRQAEQAGDPPSAAVEQPGDPRSEEGHEVRPP